MDHLPTPTTSEELFTAGDMTAETVISELNLFSKCLKVSKLPTDTFVRVVKGDESTMTLN